MSTSSTAILGVPCDVIAVEDLAEVLDRLTGSDTPRFAVMVDAHLLMLSRRDERLRRALMDASLAIGTGRLMTWACRVLGEPSSNRVTSGAFLEGLLKKAIEKNLRIFLLSSPSPEPLILADALKRQMPDLRIVGSTSLRLGEDSNRPGKATVELRKQIETSRAQIVLLNVPSPEQEKWMAGNSTVLGVPLMMGVGDELLKVAGLPARTKDAAGRGLARHLLFLFLVLWQKWRLRSPSGKPARPQYSAPVRAQESWQWIKLPERLDLQATRDDVMLLDPIIADGRHCVLEMGDVKFIDSTGIGLLIRLQKKVRVTGRKLILLNTSREVDRVLALLRLDSFFARAATLEAAGRLLGASGNIMTGQSPPRPWPALQTAPNRLR